MFAVFAIVVSFKVASFYHLKCVHAKIVKYHSFS